MSSGPKVSLEKHREVARARKTGIESSTPVSIPKMPEAWVRNTIVSLASGVVGGFVSGIIPYLLQKKKTRIRRK
jgi:pantothenate kinase type III